MSTALLRPHDDILEARAHIFRAFGDKNRLRIFQTLVEAEKPLNVTETSEHVELSPHLVSHHLQSLKDGTVVTMTKNGRERFYDVAWPEAVEIVQLANDCIEQDIETVLDCEIVETTGENDA